MRAIIVFFDSLNRRYLPSYNPLADTYAPNFDRLARRCVQFDNSYVGSMPCIPARRELHTGRYNFLHREWGPLEPFDDSMPQILRDAGVYTHLVSDHLHYWEDGGATFHTRYSSWEVVRGQEGDHWKGQCLDPEVPPVVMVPQKQQGGGVASGWRYDWVNRGFIAEEDEFPQARTFDLGCSFLEENSTQDNWLLHLETFDPHEPFYVPQRYLDLYPEEYDGAHFDWPRGPVGQMETEVAHVRRQYKALVSMCDHNLGRVLDLMDEHDMWDDTMLIVGTDHGFMLGEHGWWGKNQVPYYNEVAHTPFFVWDPRLGVAGKRRSSIVQMIDWAPTLLEFFGQGVPEDMQGSSLSGVIRDDTPNRPVALYGVFSGHVNVTDGRHAYLRAARPELKDEVFNYTLMPTHMTSRFTPSELRDAELVEPFSFTKGCPVLKVKSHDKYNVARFGSSLYDLESDPGEQEAVFDPSAEKRLTEAMIEAMRKTDAPQEQYQRLGLPS